MSEVWYLIGSLVVVVAFLGPVAWVLWWLFGLVRGAYARADETDRRYRSRDA